MAASHNAARRRLVRAMCGFIAALASAGSADGQHTQPKPAKTSGQQKTPIDVTALRLGFFDYDRSIPLSPQMQLLPDKDLRLTELRVRYHLVYESAHSQKVTAIFAEPRRFAPPYPAVVLLAGSGGHKDTDYIRVAADMMATLGYATISIDAQYHGERTKPGHTGDFHFINSAENRDAWIQTVLDLRRAVDFLTLRPEIAKNRIGYLGFSQGGIVGADFIGVEPRISMALLAVPGAGFVRWSKRLGLYRAPWRHELEVNAAIVDPIYFIGRFSGRPLLVCSALHDELIPRFATDALYSAARPPKQIVWYPSGHVLNPILFIGDARRFFVRNLGVRRELPRTSSNKVAP